LAGAIDGEDVSDRPELIGNVNRSLSSVFGELCLFHRAHDADDGEGVDIDPFVLARRQALADGAAGWPVVPGEVLVHDTNPVAGIGVRKKSPFAQGDTQGGKQVTADAIKVVPAKRFPGPAHMTLDGKTAFYVLTAERHVVDHASGRHTGLAPDTL